MHTTAILSSSMSNFGLMVAVCAVVLSSNASAQFVHAGPFVNVGTDLHTLVVATEAEYPNTGIFVAFQAEPFDVQSVNPSQLDKSKTSSFFLVFNKKTNTYSELKLQNGKSYSIRPGSSFSISLESSDKTASTRVSVANTVNPYCSIVISRGKLPSILGFVGIQEMISIARNDKAVALLEANQMLATDEYKGIIYDFMLERSGELTLNGKAFAGESLGIAVPNENPCMRPGAEWIDEELIPKNERPEGKVEELVRAVAKNKSLARTTEDFLISNISRGFIAALDFKSGDFGVIKDRGSVLGKTYCSFTKVDAR